MDDREQTPEELHAHYGPGGPVDAARRWLAAVIVDGDLAAVWPETDGPLRLTLAQRWTWANRIDPSLVDSDARTTAKELADGPPHPLWRPFENATVRQLRQVGVDFDTWVFLSRPRPLGVDLELLKYVEEEMILDGPTMVCGLQFIMRHTEQGWLMAALGDVLPEPSWPPRHGR